VRKPLIAGLTLSVLLSLSVFRAVDLWWWRAQMLKAESARAGTLAFILSEYIRELFAAADTSLRQLALHSQRVGGPGAPDEDWLPSLASAKAGLTGVGSITVTNADGIIRHSTQAAIVGQSRSDQYMFKRLAAGPSDQFVVDTPFRTIVEPKAFVIPIGRRLTTRDGAFDGIVVVTVLPAAPRTFFRTIHPAHREGLWVFHPDGFVLFREPSDGSPLGEVATGNPIFEAAKRAGGPGVLEAAVTGGGPTMLTAFHVAPIPELVVAVSLNRDALLSDWWRQVVGSAVFFVVLGLTLMGTLVVLFRQMDARRQVEWKLAVAQQLESARLTAINAQLSAALAAEQEAREHVEASGRLKDEFLMTVSHELRTPLTAIYGWARILASGSLTPEQKRSALQAIERNVEVQARLVDDLLDVSRIIGGKLRLELRTVNPAEVMMHAVQTVQPAADARSIQVDTIVDPGICSLVCDPDRLQQIVWNLLSNAIKFTPAGGRVQVFVARAEDRIEIAISDTGAGISPEFLPYVFDRFRQERSGTKRRHGGLGLGLSIVRHLVELHGGSVTAHSDGEGQGATFRVELPLRAQPPVEPNPTHFSRTSAENDEVQS
jgi:signal transduction histidine kinase